MLSVRLDAPIAANNTIVGGDHDQHGWIKGTLAVKANNRRKTSHSQRQYQADQIFHLLPSPGTPRTLGKPLVKPSDHSCSYLSPDIRYSAALTACTVLDHAAGATDVPGSANHSLREVGRVWPSESTDMSLNSSSVLRRSLHDIALANHSSRAPLAGKNE